MSLGGGSPTTAAPKKKPKEKNRLIGRQALVNTSQRGVLGKPTVGRKQLTAV